ncbi:MAG: DUF1566 domain-containing protein, partial [Bacteroidales bacterium]|nr:DUF1566 domain-containing protein [Bacteroidales bacterium]
MKPKSFIPAILSLWLMLFLISCEKWDLDRKQEIVTLDVVEVSYTTARLSADFRENDAVNIHRMGFCWSTTPWPDLSDSLTDVPAGNSFEAEITALRAGENYYFRAFVRSEFGIVFSDQLKLRTLEGGDTPIIVTDLPLILSQQEVQCGGNILFDGGSQVTLRGLCWSESPTPTISGDTTMDGKGMGKFSRVIKELYLNTTYYVRAYAITSSGVFYGNEQSFKLQGSGSLPMVNTAPVNGITQSTALSGGTVISGGGLAVSERGVCWSTGQGPTIAGERSFDGEGTGAFSSILYGLYQNTTYYVRAYATNSMGTSYGEEYSFTTLSSSTVPIVSTLPVSGIGQTSAMGGGVVSSGGGSPVIARGLCWDTDPGPTTSDSKVIEGTGTGNFSASITGLSPNTTYYVRAFASNINGASYGNEVSFTTTGSAGFFIGQSYGGGIIFYLETNGLHGLIAAPMDQGTGIGWGCYGTSIAGASGIGIGTGATNTASIVGGCSALNSAARICYNLVLNGFDDWYLPSREELNMLYIARDQVGNFKNSFYWSSTQSDANEAYQQNFSTGLQISYGKY